MAELPVIPDFNVTVSGAGTFTIRDFRNLSDDQQDRVREFMQRAVFEEIPPECMCQDSYQFEQVLILLKDTRGEAEAAQLRSVYSSLLPYSVVKGDFDPLRFLVIQGGQPFGGFCWFAISGQLVSGEFHATARLFPMFPTLGATAKARATMEVVETFFARRFIVNGRTARLRQAQVLVFRNASRNGAGDMLSNALSGELVTRSTRQSSPLVVTSGQTGLSGRILYTISQQA